MMMMLVNMARKFGVTVEHQNSLFVLRNPSCTLTMDQTDL